MLQEEFQSQGNVLFRYRSHLPLIILVFGLVVYAKVQYEIREGMRAALPFTFDVLCLTVSLIGLLIRAYTVGHTPKNTSGRNTAEGQVADEVNTTGIYSMVRHPLYLGNFFMWLGIGLYTADAWFTITFILVYYLYYERIMYAEEQFLLGKFGEVYASWAKVTPAFIPAMGKWKKPRLPFSWKKVMKKEKNGLFATFLVFFIFSNIGDYIQGRPLMSSAFWLCGTVASGALYLVLKVLKK